MEKITMSGISSSVPPTQSTTTSRAAADAAATSSSSSVNSRSIRSCEHGGSNGTAADQFYIPKCFMRYAERINSGEMVGFFDIFEDMKNDGLGTPTESTKKVLLRVITDLLLDADTINNQLQIMIQMYHEMDTGVTNRRILSNPNISKEQKRKHRRDDFQLLTKITRSKLDAIRFISPLIPCNCLDEQKQNLKAQPRVRQCEFCQKDTSKSKLQLCSRCKSVEFCSKECQIKGWTFHKSVCKSIGD